MKYSFLLVFALACGTAGCTWAFSPIIDGASSELAIRVVDDSSIPVVGAEVYRIQNPDHHGPEGKCAFRELRNDCRKNDGSGQPFDDLHFQSRAK